MRWRKLLTRWFSIQVGVIAAAVPFSLSAQSPMPAALPEDILPGLKPLLQQAVNQSPSMLAANIENATAEAYAYGDRSGLWPSVSAYGRYEHAESAVSAKSSTTTKTDGPTYGISFSQPIFYWGSLKAQADIGTLRIRIAERQYAEAYRLLALSLRNQYLTLIQKKMTLSNQRQVLKSTESNLALQEARLRDGRISQGEIISPRLQVDEARITTDKAQEDYETARRALARLVGIAEIADDSVPSDIPKPTFAPETIGAYFEQMKRSGAENSILLQTYLDTIQQNELAYKIAKTRLYPKFLISGSFNQINQTSVVGGTPSITAITTTAIGVGANWTIFDGFATRGAKLSALAAKRLAEQRLKTFKETTTETARALEKQIGFAGRLMDLTEIRKALADDAVKKVESDVRSGVSSQTGLDTFTQTANTAALAALTARANFLSSWSEYVSVLGADPALNNLPPRYLRNGKQ